MNKPHVCTPGPHGCLGSTRAFGRRFYYCKKTKPIIVRLPTSYPGAKGPSRRGS